METQVKAFTRIDELDAVIDRLVRRKISNGTPGQTTYSAALLAVAREQPDLFLTRARAQLDATLLAGRSIFFDYENGQLVNPRVLDLTTHNLVPLGGPLTAQPSSVTPDPLQQMAIEEANRMGGKISASDRLTAQGVEALIGAEVNARMQSRGVSYAAGFRMLASERPALFALRGRLQRGAR